MITGGLIAFQRFEWRKNRRERNVRRRTCIAGLKWSKTEVERADFSCKILFKKIDHFITYEIAIYSKMYLPKGWDMKLFPPLKRTKTLASSCQSLTSSTSWSTVLSRSLSKQAKNEQGKALLFFQYRIVLHCTTVVIVIQHTSIVYTNIQQWRQPQYFSHSSLPLQQPPSPNQPSHHAHPQPPWAPSYPFAEECNYSSKRSLEKPFPLK